MSGQPKKKPRINIIVTAALIVLVAFGAACFIASFISFEHAKPMLDRLSHDGYANVKESVYRKVSAVMQWAGLVLVTTSGILLFFRKQVGDFLLEVGDSFAALFIESARVTAKFVNRENRFHLSALLFICLASSLLRFYFSAIIAMRYDESFTFITYASQPFHYIITNYAFPNNHIFHTVLVRCAYLLFGNAPWVLRLPALVSGILLVPASYVTARYFYNKHVGLLTASLIGTSCALIEYSTNARGYILLCIIFMVLLFMGRFLLRKNSLSVWILFIGISSAGFYVMPNMVYPFGIVVCWIVIEALSGNVVIERKILLRNFTISLLIVMVAVCLLYVPVFAVSGDQVVFWMNRFKIKSTLASYVQGLYYSLHPVWSYWNYGIPTGLNHMLLVGFLLSLFCHKRVADHTTPMMIPIVLFLIPCLFFQKVIPPRRVWLFLLPLYLMTASAGIYYGIGWILRKKQKDPALVFNCVPTLIVVLLSMYAVIAKPAVYSNEGGSLRSADQITLHLRSYLKKGDRVVAYSPSNYPLLYYFVKYNLSTDYIVSNPIKTAHRVILIVNDFFSSGNEKDALDGILSQIESQLKAGTFDHRPRLLKKYDGSSIYVIERMTT